MANQGILPALEPWQESFENTIVYPYEGYSATMYLDTIGLVTVGRGCQISATEAVTLPFKLAMTLATPVQIAVEYARVSGMAKGHSRSFYKGVAALTLDPMPIELLCRKRILSNTDLLKSLFPGFAGWPDAAKIATLEMPWGLGEYKFRTSYPLLRRSLIDADFEDAAAECAWNDPSGIYSQRNENRIALYKQAAQEVA